MGIDVKTMGSLLDDLWLSTVQDLIAKIKEGSAAPTDIGNAIKLLRDNGIVMDAKQGKQTLEELVQSMTTGEDDPKQYLDCSGKLSIEVVDPELGDEIRQ